MQNNKLRAFLPYMIIIGIVYLAVPALLLAGSDVITYVVLIGLLPLTALLCCAHYSMRVCSYFPACLAAPLCFVITMLVYGLVQSDPLRAFIYLIAYFLCGYLGLTIGDILANRGDDKRDARAERPRPAPRDDYAAPAERSARPAPRPAPSNRARRVNVEAVDEPAPMRAPAAPPRASRVDVDAYDAPGRFEAADPYDDRSLDQSTTTDDIDAILREIHQRRGSE